MNNLNNLRSGMKIDQSRLVLSWLWVVNTEKTPNQTFSERNGKATSQLLAAHRATLSKYLICLLYWNYLTEAFNVC